MYDRLLIGAVIGSFCFYLTTVFVSSSVSASILPDTNKNYNPYQYDLTVPQYTPDGRLLQIEYAIKASTDHSIPIIVAYYCCHHTMATKGNNNNNTQNFIMNDCAMNDNDENYNNHDNFVEQITIYISGRRNARGQQSRLIVLPSFTSIIHSSSTSRQDHHHHPIPVTTTNANTYHEPCMIVAISGILCDALAILQIIQSYRIQEYRTMGYDFVTSGISASLYSKTKTKNHHCYYKNPCTTNTHRIASYLASKCQSWTLSGGNRPYGTNMYISSSLNFGFYPTNIQNDDHPKNVGYGYYILHKTDPSGSIQDILIDDMNPIAVLGGGSIGSVIKQRIQKEWKPSSLSSLVHASSAVSIKHMIQRLLDIVVDEYSKHYWDHQEQLHENDDRYSVIVQRKRSDVSKEQEQEDYRRVLCKQLEVVLISSRRGIVKLTSEQLQKVLVSS